MNWSISITIQKILRLKNNLLRKAHQRYTFQAHVESFLERYLSYMGYDQPLLTDPRVFI